MYKIFEVNKVEYFSDTVNFELIKNLLLGSELTDAGRLILKLHTGRKLEQEGPYLIPPIRWLDSFEDNNEFVIECVGREC